MVDLGVIAGRGDLPLELIGHLKKQHRPFKLFLIKNSADPKEYCHHPFTLFNIQKDLGIFKAFSQQGGSHIVVAGSVKIKTEQEFRKSFAPTEKQLKKGLGDNRALKIIEFYFQEHYAIKMVAPQTIMPELLCTHSGAIGDFSPQIQDLDDIQYGAKFLKDISHYDIGQSVIIRSRRVIGMEAAEHTNSLIERSKILMQNQGKGGVLVKLPKKNQLKTMDWPAIGPETVQRAADAGLNGIGLYPGGALLIQRKKLIEIANQKKLFIFVMKKRFWPFSL